ncbi:restriction endonuclease subunit S [Pseudaeromonas sp. ZJS20]|uniref:restriction endonuclease subunit S n=1 Tax=Pseudaeromonas aegiceratis TaxID=3153928 RepID=UPI00390C653D
MGHNNIFSQLELMQARLKSIPDGWSFNYVGKAFAIRNNLRKPISEEERAKNPGCYPYYGPTKIQGYIGSYEQDGCFALIGEDGDHFLKYNEQSMTQLVDGKCTINNHAHIIEGTKTATREWFYYYFMHRDIFSFLSRQGAGRYKLNKASLEKIPVLIPPVIEQNKIFQILSTWDQAISTTEQLLANSQQQKKALMQQLLTGKKRLLDKNGVRFSGAWKKFKFGSLFSERVEIGRDDLPLLSITADDGVVYQEDTGRKNTSNEDKSKYRRICVNDIGYNTMRMWQGRSSLSNREGIVSPAYTIVTPNSKIEPLFAAYLFKFPELVHVFYRHSQGLVSDTWNLKFSHFKKISWIIPIVEEQQKIASVLTAADQEIAILQRKLDYLKQEKKALMQQLLTGKRRVKI